MTRSGIEFAAVLACLLAGCTVGPKYKAPDVPITLAYKETDAQALKACRSSVRRSLTRNIPFEP